MFGKLDDIDCKKAQCELYLRLLLLPRLMLSRWSSVVEVQPIGAASPHKHQPSCRSAFSAEHPLVTFSNNFCFLLSHCDAHRSHPEASLCNIHLSFRSLRSDTVLAKPNQSSLHLASPFFPIMPSCRDLQILQSRPDVDEILRFNSHYLIDSGSWRLSQSSRLGNPA